MTKIAFIVGPIDNIEKRNFPAYALCQEKLESLGYQALNTHEFLEGIDVKQITADEQLKLRATHLLQSEIVVTLPGWESDPNAVKLIGIARLVNIEVESEVRFFEKNPVTKANAV